MDLRKVLTVLLAGGKGQRLGPLTQERAKPAVPFGGIYRIVDFALSNCVHSELRRTLVLVQYRSRSLSQHIREAWGHLFNTARGEFVETLPPQQNLGDRWYAGTADAVRQNLFAVREERPDTVLILSGDHIYKMDYRDMLKAHEETGARITVAAVEVPRPEGSGFGILQVGRDGRILSFREKPADPDPVPEDPNVCLASMGVYVFDAALLEELLEEDARDPASSHDFGKDILPKAIGRQPVFVFRFIDRNRKESKYWRDVGTIEAFYDANMDLVGVDPQLNLYDPAWPIYTRATTAPPPKFVFREDKPDGRTGQALDSIVSPGCIVSGGRVIRSVLSPYVRINSYSLVEDSILFENVDVGRHARVRRAIIDKDVRIPEGTRIGYDPEEDRRRFMVSDGGIVVISKRAVL